MSGPYVLGDCPQCGEPLLMVFREWHASTRTVDLERHHREDPRREARGEPLKLCRQTVTYEEAFALENAQLPDSGGTDQ